MSKRCFPVHKSPVFSLIRVRKIRCAWKEGWTRFRVLWRLNTYTSELEVDAILVIHPVSHPCRASMEFSIVTRRIEDGQLAAFLTIHGKTVSKGDKGSSQVSYMDEMSPTTLRLD